MINYFKKREGQALIESIAAIGIIVFGVMGALAFLSSSVSLNRIVTNQYAATYLSSGLIEATKYCLDLNGWDSFGACLNQAEDDVNTLLVDGGLNGTTFNVLQVVDCTENGVDTNERRDVCASVGWNERGRDFQVDLEDRFYNWR